LTAPYYWPSENVYPSFHICGENIRKTETGYSISASITFCGWETNEPIHGITYHSILELSSSNQLDSFEKVFAQKVLDAVNKQKQLLESYIKNIDFD